tara:strand:+ start:1017 stop:1454 length:438 start_codon:yes stop_codon:yes gene_type:complete
MSKRKLGDTSTYTFMEMGVQNFSHGKVTIDSKSNFVQGKQITCPQCEHKFVWDKFFCLTPRYPKSWYDDPKKNKDGIPYGFQVLMEVNTPSVDEDGIGDRLPRISYIVKGAKLTIEDRVNDSSPKDSVAFRSSDKQLTLTINKMG